jgi:hypothetical protein
MFAQKKSGTIGAIPCFVLHVVSDQSAMQAHGGRRLPVSAESCEYSPVVEVRNMVSHQQQAGSVPRV